MFKGQTINISLSTGLVKDLREVEILAPLQIDARNVVGTDVNNIAKRKGYAQKWDTGTNSPITALIDEEDGYAFAENGKLYSLGSSVTEIFTGGDALGSIPTWTRWDGKTIIAYGLSPLLVDGDTVTTLGGSPPNGKFIETISSYTVLSGHDDTEFRWSQVNNPESWPAPNFANLQKTGTNIYMVEYKDRLLFFKEKEVEVWNFVGGSSPFRRYPGGKIFQGLGAKNSVVKANDRVYWFGNEYDFYVYENGIARVITDNMRRRIDEMNNPEDLIGFDIRKENVIRWINHSDGMTFDYDYHKDEWREHNRWEGSGRQSLPFTSYMELTDPNRRQYFGSSNSDGLVHEWHEDHKDDNGQPIRAYRRFKVKPSPRGRKVIVDMMQIRRQGGVATPAVLSPTVDVRFRWDNGDWSNSRQLTLGTVGKYNPYVETRRLGKGRELEVEISEMDAVDFVMTNVSLTVRELGY